MKTTTKEELHKELFDLIKDYQREYIRFNYMDDETEINLVMDCISEDFTTKDANILDIDNILDDYIAMRIEEKNRLQKTYTLYLDDYDLDLLMIVLEEGKHLFRSSPAIKETEALYQNIKKQLKGEKKDV